MTNHRTAVNGNIHHIRVQGNLDQKWADWFEGFVMAARDNGQTLLSGRLADQAALHGALARIHSLGLPLLLVARTECPCTSKKCPRRGNCHECVAHHAAQGKLAYCFREKNRWDKRCTALTQAR
jgi:hypothetical protein